MSTVNVCETVSLSALFRRQQNYVMRTVMWALPPFVNLFDTLVRPFAAAVVIRVAFKPVWS